MTPPLKVARLLDLTQPDLGYVPPPTTVLPVAPMQATMQATMPATARAAAPAVRGASLSPVST